MDEHLPLAGAVVDIDPRLETEWDDLAVRSGAVPFARPAWVRAWANASGRVVRAATVRRGSRLAAVMPVVVGRRSIATAADWHVPWIEAVSGDSAAMDALVEHVLAGRRRVSIDFVRGDGATAAAFTQAFDRRGFSMRPRARLVSPYIDFEHGWQAYAECLPAKKWRELRRRRRRLDEVGPVEFDISDGTSDLDRLLDEGFGIEGSGWKTDRGTAILSDRRVERFYREVTCWAASQGMARLSFLRVGGRPIAFDLSFVHDGSEWLLKTGFDPGWSTYSPGSLLRAEALRSAFENEVRWYEFAGAAEPWKLEWTHATRDIVILDGFAPGVAGAVWMQASRIRRRLRAMRSVVGP